ncbi:MAG: hypothetical protein V7L14_23320 [Nostoc sp.]
MLRNVKLIKFARNKHIETKTEIYDGWRSHLTVLRTLPELDSKASAT